MDTEDFGLGRVYTPDDRDYPMALEFDAAELPIPASGRRKWSIGPVLDQGHTSECVGYSWKQFLQTTPLRTMTGPSGDDIYRQAKALDGMPQGSEGTTVRAGAAAVSNEGRLQSYLFAQSMDDIIKWVLTRGPVVVGTQWYDRMFHPEQTGGYLFPGGRIVGGHAYLLYMIDQPNNEGEIVSSWGLQFNQTGTAKIKLDALDFLMRQQGEACTAVERRVKVA